MKLWKVTEMHTRTKMFRKTLSADKTILIFGCRYIVWLQSLFLIVLGLNLHIFELFLKQLWPVLYECGNTWFYINHKNTLFTKSQINSIPLIEEVYKCAVPDFRLTYCRCVKPNKFILSLSSKCFFFSKQGILKRFCSAST